MFSMGPVGGRSGYSVYAEVSVLAVTQLGLHAQLKGTTMTQNQWEPLARLSTTSEAIDGLRDLFANEEPLHDASARVATTASHAIPHADIVSITVLTWPDARTAAHTHDLALTLDQQQYDTGRGPCLEAALQREPVRTEISAETDRWPEFVQAAQQARVRASLSIPLIVGGLDEEQVLVGSLNIYSYTASAFDPFDEALMRLFSVAAGQAITNARRWQHSRETVTQLERALISRPEIEMAKGALIAQHGCNPEEAFARLVDQSQRRNVKLHVIAQELLSSLQTASTD
jgi:GAF domain-containing protein